MRGSPRPLLLAAVPLALLFLAAPALPKKPKREPCPGGRFLVQTGEHLVIGGSTTTRQDVVILEGSQIAVDSGCPFRAGRIKATKKGTKVIGRWSACGTLRKAVLNALIAPDCNTMAIRFKAKKTPAKSLQATRSVCGDEIVDPGNGERCEPPGSASCDANCQSVVTTTTSTTTPATSSTTSTSIPALHCGDGYLDPGEQCDLPGEDCAPGQVCTLSCACTPAEGVLLSGSPDSTALDAVYDLVTLNPIPDSDISLDAGGNGIARTTFEIAFATAATIGDVNSLLQSNNARIVGMLADTLILAVRIPDPGTLAELDVLMNRLSLNPLVRYVRKAAVPQVDALPDLYSAQPALSPPLAHLLAHHAPAAWNAKAALPSVTSRPLLIIADEFGFGNPDAAYDIVPLFPIGFGDQIFGDRHGYQMLSVIAARWEHVAGISEQRDRAIGMFPSAIEVWPIQAVVPTAGWFPTNNNYHNVFLQVENSIVYAVKETVKAHPGRPIIVNTSLGLLCSGPSLSCGIDGIAWLEKLRGTAGLLSASSPSLETRFLHATSAGNAGLLPAADTIPFATAALAPLVLGGRTVPSAQNILVVEDLTPSNAPGWIVPGCPDPHSQIGGHVSAVGTDVYMLKGPADSDGVDVNSGTSPAAAQVAGLAAYVWALAPHMTVQEVKERIFETAKRPSNCPTGAAAIDAYAAVLAIDTAVQSRQQAPIRATVLDAAGVPCCSPNGTTCTSPSDCAPGETCTTTCTSDADCLQGETCTRIFHFDECDLTAYLAGGVSGAEQLDYSRVDLNGDGITGGDRHTAIDLNADRLMSQVPTATGGYSYDETAASDLDALCYYAYSPLYEGDPAARDALLTLHDFSSNTDSGNACTRPRSGYCGDGQVGANEQCDPAAASPDAPCTEPGERCTRQCRCGVEIPCNIFVDKVTFEERQ